MVIHSIESANTSRYPSSTRDAIVNVRFGLTVLHSDVRKDGSTEKRSMTVTWHMPLAKVEIWKSIWKSRISIRGPISKAVSKKSGCPVLISASAWQGCTIEVKCVDVTSLRFTFYSLDYLLESD